MYAIKSGGKVVGYSDTVVYVRLHENGCYVPCDEAEAGGSFTLSPTAGSSVSSRSAPWKM